MKLGDEFRRAEKDFSLLSARLWRWCLAGSVTIFIFCAPWFYGLTRFRDQLVGEISILTLFLITFLFSPLYKGLLRDNSEFPHGKIREKVANFLPFKGLDAWLFLLILFSFCYVLFSSLPYISLMAFFRLTSVILFYFLVRCSVRTDEAFRFFLWIIVLVGTFYAAYGLVQYYDILSHTYWYRPYSLASRYVNGGHFAALLFFSLMIGISFMLYRQNPMIRFGVVPALLFIQTWALLLTRSRTVWLVFLLGVSVFIILNQGRHSWNGKAVFFALLMILVGGAILWKLGVFREVGIRFYRLWETKFYSMNYRFQLWEGCLRAIAERPGGWGIGTFSMIFPRFRVNSDRFLIDYAHNEFFQIAVDFGIFGILFLMGFLRAYFQAAFSFLKSSHTDRAQKAVGTSFLVLGMGLLIMSQTDFPLRIYATSFLFAVYLALSAYLFDPHKKALLEPLPPVLTVAQSSFYSSKGALVLRLACFFLVFGANLLVTKQLLAQIHFERGFKLEKDLLWPAAEKEYAEAISFAPSYFEPHEALGRLYRRKAAMSLNREKRKEFSQRAIISFENAVKRQPYLAGSHYVLALLYAQSDSFENAREHFTASITFDPLNALFVYEYGHFALRHGDLEAAIQSFEKFHRISFREGINYDACQILREFYKQTQNYDDLRRVIADTWQDHNCLAYLLAENQRWDKARLEFDLAIKNATRIYDFKTYMTEVGRVVADFYASHNHFEEALAIYQEAVTRNPENLEYERAFQGLLEKIPSGEKGFLKDET